MQLKSIMSDDPILIELISRRADNQVLQILSQYPALWTKIVPSLNKNEFWYDRSRILLGDIIGTYNPDVNWKQVYNIMESADRVNPFSPYGSLEKEENGYNTFAVKLLLRLGYDPSVNGGSTLYYAVMFGSVEVVRLLLADKRMNIRIRIVSSISEAAALGRLDIMRELLLHTDTSKLSVQPILSSIIKSGQVASIKLLLESVNVSSDTINSSIESGISNLSDDAILLLLNDKRANPSVPVINLVLRYSKLQVVKKILLMTGYNPPLANIFTVAENNDNRGVLEFVLSRARTPPSKTDLFTILSRAVENGKINNVEFLLGYDDINVVAYNNSTLKKAVDKKYIDIVELLLLDGRVDPSVDDNYPLKTAINLLDLDMIELLLSDDRTDIYGEVTRTFLLSKDSLDPRMRDVSSLLLSDYRAFQGVSNETIEYARSKYSSFGHYDKFLREILRTRLTIGDYLDELIEYTSSPKVHIPTGIIISSAARSIDSKYPIVHKSEFFTPYRAFFLLCLPRNIDGRVKKPNRAEIMKILQSESGVTQSGLEKADMLLEAYEAGRV